MIMSRMIEIDEGYMPSFPVRKLILLPLVSSMGLNFLLSCTRLFLLVDSTFLLPCTIYLCSAAQSAIWLVCVNSTFSVIPSNNKLATFTL